MHITLRLYCLLLACGSIRLAHAAIRLAIGARWRPLIHARSLAAAKRHARDARHFFNLWTACSIRPNVKTDSPANQ